MAFLKYTRLTLVHEPDEKLVPKRAPQILHIFGKLHVSTLYIYMMDTSLTQLKLSTAL